MSAHDTTQPDAHDAAPLDQHSCFTCEREPGTIEAFADDKPVVVCPACFAYETGEDPEEAA